MVHDQTGVGRSCVRVAECTSMLLIPEYRAGELGCANPYSFGEDSVQAAAVFADGGGECRCRMEVCSLSIDDELLVVLQKAWLSSTRIDF